MRQQPRLGGMMIISRVQLIGSVASESHCSSSAVLLKRVFFR